MASNPAFSNSPAFSQRQGAGAPFASGQTGALSTEQLDELYGRPSATPSDTGRMTYEDTVVKTVITFGVLLAGAVVGWIVPALAIPAAIIGLVLGFVNVFKRKPSRGLILAYAAFEGVFIGGISQIFETEWQGIVGQAVIGTLVVVGVTLALFASGKVRESKRATQIFMVAMVAYAVFSLVNLGLMLFGVVDDPWGVRGLEIFGIPLGALLGVLAIGLGAYSLVLNFEDVKRGVRNGAPRIFGWQAAFGIMVTVVWLYTEILRLLAILRGSE
jgi:uncharacterized YccA/Bax inhibitor family protein